MLHSVVLSGAKNLYDCLRDPHCTGARRKCRSAQRITTGRVISVNQRRSARFAICVPILFPIESIVTAGNFQDRDGAKTFLEEISTQTDLVRRLELIWADGGYRGELVSWVEETLGWKLEIVEMPKDQSGFQALPNHWIVSVPLPGWFASLYRVDIYRDKAHGLLKTQRGKSMNADMFRVWAVLSWKLSGPTSSSGL